MNDQAELPGTLLPAVDATLADAIAGRVLAALRAEPLTAPLLFDQPAAWRFLGVSRSEFFRLKSAGDLPDPVKIPGRDTPVYRRADLERFAERLKRAR